MQMGKLRHGQIKSLKGPRACEGGKGGGESLHVQLHEYL